MNLPNKRSGKILRILLNNQKPIIIKKLAKEFDVSARTIRSDLKKLEEWLELRNITLIKKPRVGVWIECDSVEKTELERQLFKAQKNNDLLSPSRRQKYILKCLLETDKQYTMKLLAEELYVSRSTIYKDLKKVETWLSKYGLILERKRNCGIKVRGDEKKWRKAVADLLAELKGDQELKKILEKETSLEPDSRIDTKTYQQLKSLFGDIDFRNIEKILKEAENELGFLFTDEAFAGLVIHIAISIERLEQGKDIKMDQEQLNNLKAKEEFKVAEYITTKLENILKIKIPKDEVGYISLHILGAKLQQNIQTKSVTDVLENTDSKIVKVAKEVINLAAEVLEVEFQDDKQLLVGLVLHLRPAINRLKYGMSLRNPLLDRIKEDYPSVFGAAWASSIIFEKHLGIKVNEEEVGYIALHLGAALERINKKIKAVIVCSSGIGTSQLIASRLAKRLSGIEIMDLMAAHKLKNKNLEEIDVIISTIPLNDLEQPVIQVSPLVTENDINLVKQKTNYILQDKEAEKLELDLELNKIHQLLNQNLIFVNLDVESKEEIIKFLSQQLLDRNSIKEDFIESALDREKITSTGVGNKVAIPHGKEDYVLESKIAIATLENPIKWGAESVNIVFLLALKNKESKVFFKHFHKILDNPKAIKKLEESTTKENIIKSIL
ncbi:transcriptional antiterminator [Halobacteroides halobius DSM 5150]|uniref:Transcriptional antiterminator n=1 Tax=Halobacteroides halobius (strain ATCC 35273 / DSM 5150 / MD-1) TaxID=748449 RepID=L0K8K7_HALHC|nr:BglG family transcription antiterminator [Halobacteroides halobius]AGB40453.1 transcriptional antiterminator [Halobacteroides halobius DSM 5150]